MSDEITELVSKTKMSTMQVWHCQIHNVTLAGILWKILYSDYTKSINVQDPLQISIFKIINIDDSYLIRPYIYGYPCELNLQSLR